MRVQKVEKVDFAVNLVCSGQTKVNVVWKKGELFLSLSGIYLTDKELWYELPLKEIRYVELINDEVPTKLQIGLDSIDVMVSGADVNHLKALRHLILPYITVENN